MPDSVKICLEEGINLYKLHTNRHGRLVHHRYDYPLFCKECLSSICCIYFKRLAYYICACVQNAEYIFFSHLFRRRKIECLIRYMASESCS